MEEKLKEYTNLGWVNDWEQTPKKVVNCRELGHKRQELKNKQRSLTTVICDECKIFWKFDSGG